MKKQKYYVALNSGEIMGEILQQPTDSSYAFEIEATESEVRQLNSLLGNLTTGDMGTFWNAHIPFLYYNESGKNEGYDQSYQQIYETLYQLGTPNTKKQIEQLGLLQMGQDSWDPEGPVY
ncbi:hydrolase [Kroppenstedtia sanguinis]|uniref:Hydrolase n=1 Tax=Kroppenstedtia sanguinis TaxID=1380684 RepID=A0ABW4C5C0_9BACL